MPTVMVTFIQATYMSWQHLTISAISQILLTRFWQNCLDPIFWGPWFFEGHILLTKLLLTQIFFGPKIFCTKNFFTLIFLTRLFGPKIFCTRNLIDLKFADSRFFFDQDFFYPKFFGPNFFWTKFSSLTRYLTYWPDIILLN